MLPLSTSQTVSLDVLNNYNESIARFDACLQHLHGDWASLTMPASAPLSLVHWGTQVRFCLTDGAQGFEAFGVVVARETTNQAEAAQEVPAMPAHPPAAAVMLSRTLTVEDCGTGSPNTQGVREVVVRLYQCNPFGERRSGPRRWTRFGVRLSPLPASSRGARPGLPELENSTEGKYMVASETLPAPLEPCWDRGWAVDISGGGMRLRTYASLPLRQRLALQFWLPDAHAKQAATHACRFEVVGRVLRSQRTRSRASLYESMVCFEQLSPEDGLALDHFLSLQSQIPCCK